jgi:hypothetical protein
MFLAIWQFLSPSDATPGHARPPAPPPASGFDPWIVATPAAMIVLVVGALWLQLWLTRREIARFARAELAVARGDVERATAELTALSKSSRQALAAQAHLLLARLGERDARWPDVITRCDTGLATATRNAMIRVQLVDLTIPELTELRALALAAMDRRAESDAELAILGRDYPTYPFQSRALVRAQLVGAMRARDLAAAADIARSRTIDLPLSVRDDTLADLALVLAGGASNDEIERVDSELRDDPKVRAWIDAIAPDARARLQERVATRAVEDVAAEEADAPGASG